MEFVRRVFVEKRPGFDVEARHLLSDLRENLGIRGLERVRICKRYDLSGLTDDEYLAARDSVLSEPNCDVVYDEALPSCAGQLFAVEFLPGQYDQRADSAAQCVQLLTQKDRPLVRSATQYVLEGAINAKQLATIKSYLINPVESQEASLDKPASLAMSA
ncbi:MAG: phosphoribosylformylglycinamidine synthase, partial [Lentisphaeria bacterium]|nr:phosphoribosylformylglycinamidine synthase [Lentisphaeria bacterium]